MSEPPDEEDYDAAWENADAEEIMGGLEDDALLDSIAQGVRGELGPDQLTELLAGLRDVPDALDIPMKNTARVERGENVIPPRRSEERTHSVLSESIAQLAAIGDDSSIAGALTEAKNELETSTLAKVQAAVERLVELKDQALNAVQGNSSDEGEISSTSEHAAGAIEDAMDAVQAAMSAVDQAMQHTQAFHTAATNIARKHSG